MQFKAVGRVSVRHMRLEVGGQIDDVDCAKWTLFGANTTTDAERFRDEGNLGFGSDFNAQPTAADHRAGLFTLLATFL